MKYKGIKSDAHNFTHSFVSYMNYVDDGYVIDDLRECARKAKGRRVTIHWLSPQRTMWFSFKRRIRKSICYYQKWLPTHLHAHSVSPGMLAELRTDIFLATSRQVLVELYVRDSRGRGHVQAVAY
jgi:hypothetical protein